MTSNVFPESADSPSSHSNKISNLLSESELGAVAAVDVIIKHALERGASDIYFEPGERGTAVRYRIDGVLHRIIEFPVEYHDRMIARIKVLAHLPTYKRNTPQDGRIDIQDQDFKCSFRFSALPTILGEQIVLRTLRVSDDKLRLDELGFETSIVNYLKDIAFEPRGTILLTGPSSNGKTTTIYATLMHILDTTDRFHIVTIEDPVEHKLEGVSQSQINPLDGYNYPEAFKTVLRQDPDVISIGEIRDSETALAAIGAGLTGHLVLSTIHSGTAAGVVSRLLEMGIEPYLISSSLKATLAQRLYRTICQGCIQEEAPEIDLLERIGLATGTITNKGRGCDACNGVGYIGRSAVGELLTVGDEISELIVQRQRTNAIEECAIGLGMLPIRTALAERVRCGMTTVEEALFTIA